MVSTKEELTALWADLVDSGGPGIVTITPYVVCSWVYFHRDSVQASQFLDKEKQVSTSWYCVLSNVNKHHNQGLSQLLLTVSWDAYGPAPKAMYEASLRALEGRRVGWKRPWKVQDRNKEVALRNGKEMVLTRRGGEGSLTWPAGKSKILYLFGSPVIFESLRPHWKDLHILSRKNFKRLILYMYY